MKSDQSMDIPYRFKDGNQSIEKRRVQQERADSPGPSCVSMKSDRSMDDTIACLNDGRPSREERHQMTSKVTSAQSLQHQTELIKRAEENAHAFLDKELKKLWRDLFSDYPQCSEEDRPCRSLRHPLLVFTVPTTRLIPWVLALRHVGARGSSTVGAGLISTVGAALSTVGARALSTVGARALSTVGARALSTVGARALSTHGAESPSTHGAESPSTHGAESPSTHGAESPSTHGAESPSTHGAESPSTHGAESPSTHGAESPSTHGAETPSTHGAESPSTHGAESPSTHGAESPSTHGNEAGGRDGEDQQRMTKGAAGPVLLEEVGEISGGHVVGGLVGEQKGFKVNPVLDGEPV
ncbi:unnamed protein product [Boreogadus saida]